LAVSFNVHYNKQIDDEYKKLSNYFFVRKIPKTDSKAYFENGIRFWEKRNELNLRTHPVEAVDMFRKSYKADHNYFAKLYLTHALLYRYALKEIDEFNEFFSDIFTEIPNILESNDSEKICNYLYFALCLHIEGRLFGFNILTDEQFEFFLNKLSNMPGAEKLLSKLNNLISIYKVYLN
jgi:hypothetical protein